MKEIVAAVINNGAVTNDILLIIRAAKNGTIKRIISRAEMAFMSACDLGVNWDKLASSKTLFTIDDDGHCRWAEGVK